jgi:hypothetical protein
MGLCVLPLLCLQWPRKAAAAGAGTDGLTGGPSAAGADATQFMQQVLRTNVSVPDVQQSERQLHTAATVMAVMPFWQPEVRPREPADMHHFWQCTIRCSSTLWQTYGVWALACWLS